MFSVLPRGFPLQVRVPLEARYIVGDKRIRFLPGDSLRRSDLAPESRKQVGRAVLHVGENFGHRVAVHELGYFVSVFRQPDVHRVRIAKKIVQVAEDFLIRARQKNAE